MRPILVGLTQEVGRVLGLFGCGTSNFKIYYLNPKPKSYAKQKI